MNPLVNIAIAVADLCDFLCAALRGKPRQWIIRCHRVEPLIQIAHFPTVLIKVQAILGSQGILKQGIGH